jgi:hypothetical protein
MRWMFLGLLIGLGLLVAAMAVNEMVDYHRETRAISDQ